MNRLITLISIITLLFSSPLLAIEEDEYLKPDEAFQLTVDTAGNNMIEATWQIAEGYYLYEKRFKFKSESPDVVLGEPQFPKGKVKDDPYFGKMVVHRNSIRVAIPYTKTGSTTTPANLKVGYQGCADLGLCYAPQTKKTTLSLPPTPALAMATSSPAAALSSLSTLGQSLGLNDSDEIPTAEEAYQLTVTQDTPTELLLDWAITPGTYLYQDKIKASLSETDKVKLGQFQLPKALIKKDALRTDGTIGDLPVYYNRLQLRIPIERLTTATIETGLQVRYQGCADAGVCYPPVNKQIPLLLAATKQPIELPKPTLKAASAKTSVSEPAPQSELESVGSILASGKLFLIIGTFFLGGLLLSLTPCVFPMIPILSGIIAGQGQNITTKRAFTLSLVYVLGMALTYTAAGIAVAGFFGQSVNLQAAFQNPWILGPFALVFVLLALSMFGFYDLQLPSRWQSKLTEASNRQKGGTLTGVAIMGVLSALIVGPCVAAPLAAALVYIAESGDMVLGGTALFALSMGMGTPVLMIGTSAGKLLPKAGHWMEAVKAFFGVTMLAVAIVLLERIVPAAVAMILWGILLITSAIYMGATKSISTESSGWERLWKGLGMVLLVYGVLMMIGAAAGGKDTVQPLRGLFSTSASEHLQFKRIKSVADLEREVALASSNNSPVMLDFYADWCVSCKEMERYTFSDPKVISALSGYTLLQADVTANDATDQALLQGHFGLPGPPSIMFYNRNGEELKPQRVVGFMTADAFSQHINRANP